MRIAVNGRPEPEPSSQESLAEVIRHLRSRATSEGVVVAAAVLDGLPLTPEREAICAGRPAAEFATLEVETTTAGELVRRIFSGLTAALPGLKAQAIEVGGRLRVGDPAGAGISRIADDLGFVLEAYGEGKRFLAASGKARSGGVAAASRIALVLGEVAGGMSSGDAVRTGDALEYELAPALDLLETEIREWGAIIEAGGLGEGDGADREGPAGERGAP